MPRESLPLASRLIRVFSGTLLPAAGCVIANVPVVKAKVRGWVSGLPAASARPLPARSVIAPVRAMLTRVPKGSGALGVKRTLAFPLRKTKDPATGVVPAVTAKEAGEIVPVSIASVKVTWITVATETSVAPSAGITAATRGGIASGDAVVNVEAKVCARALPATSVTPVPTVRLNAVLSGSGRLTGVSVTMRSPSEKVNVTGTVPAVVVNRSVDSLTVVRATASENLTITVVFGSTSAAPGDGFTSATVGGTTSRTVTVTDVATPWFPAASRARASSVRDPPVGGSAAKAMRSEEHTSELHHF